MNNNPDWKIGNGFLQKHEVWLKEQAIEKWEAERRHAWDMYAAAKMSTNVMSEINMAECADLLLKERDKRFPRPE